MKELVVLAEIEQTQELLAVPTAYEPAVWQYCLYATGGVLPFMEDTYNRNPVNVNNIIIDNEEYIRFKTLELLRNCPEDKGGWVNGGNFVYVRFPFYLPPYLYYSVSCTTLIGFTNGGPLLKDGIMYKPGLLSSPNITHSVDAFTYDRMKFNTANISIDNTNGQFDDARQWFGNEFNLKVGVVENEEGQEQHLIQHEAGDEKVVATGNTDEYVVLSDKKEKEDKSFKMLAQYYIENIIVSLDKADFKLNDKRERLSAKIPSKQFTVEEYPYIDDNQIGKDMQEAYGRCFGVPGVCLEGKRVLSQYQFRFSSQISRIDKIQVKMTAGEINGQKYDGWTTVYENGQWKATIPQGSFAEMEKGIISLPFNVARQEGEQDKKINEVRMDGVFNDPKGRINAYNFVTPRDIIEDIMYKYAGVPYDDYRYDIDEVKKELKYLGNYEIGILFDKSISVYEAIEKLQNGSVYGFQFQVHENRFTVRVDYPNRDERPIAISHLEILNLNEVEVDWNASLYGTYTNIEYAYNYSDKEYRNFICKDSRNEILALHRIDKEWNAKTLLATEDRAESKSTVMLNDFKDFRPIIRNIKLSDEKWFGLQEGIDELRIYDMIFIDFSIPGDEIEKYPQHIIRLIQEVGEENIISIEGDTDEYIVMSTDEKEAQRKRDFMGYLRCQVININQDTKSGITTIDVRVIKKEKSTNIPLTLVTPPI